jgi:hypothetical protein
MGFGSFFKRKKKNVEDTSNDVEDTIAKGVQPEDELYKANNSLSAEKVEHQNTNEGPSKADRIQTDEVNRLEPEVSRTTQEVTLNIDSQLLSRARSKGINISSILEDELKKRLSGV